MQNKGVPIIPPERIRVLHCPGRRISFFEFRTNAERVLREVLIERPREHEPDITYRNATNCH